MRDKFFKSPVCISYLMVYVLCVILDIRYLVKWTGYGESESAMALFIPAMILHLVFVILPIIFFRQKNTSKQPVIILLILTPLALFSISTINSMTEYVYKSRNGTYDKTIADFQKNATMQVTSESLVNGRWIYGIASSGKGSNLSPQLSFNPVDGASYYVIYMVDESANNWVHWYAEVTGNSIDLGANVGQYIGPYPPEGSGDHTYTIYVYALEDKPGVRYDGNYPEFDEPWFAGDILWAGVLNIQDATLSPALYGNVLEYGYISGVYSN